MVTKHDLQLAGLLLLLKCNNLVMVTHSREHILPKYHNTCLSHNTLGILNKPLVVILLAGTRQLEHQISRLVRELVMITIASSLSSSKDLVVLRALQIIPVMVTVSHQFLAIIHKDNLFLKVATVDMQPQFHNLDMVSLSQILRVMISSKGTLLMVMQPTQPPRDSQLMRELRGIPIKHLQMFSHRQQGNKDRVERSSQAPTRLVIHLRALPSQVMEFPLPSLVMGLNRPLDMGPTMPHLRVRNLQPISRFMRNPNNHPVLKEAMCSLLLCRLDILTRSPHHCKQVMLHLIQLRSALHYLVMVLQRFNQGMALRPMV